MAGETYLLTDNVDGRGFDRKMARETSDGSAHQPIATTIGGFIDPSFFQETGMTALVAGFDIDAGDQVYIHTDGKARKADADSFLAAVGFAPAAILQNETGYVIFQDGAINNALTGLNPGKDYYLDASGAVTDSVPTANMKQYVGTALTASLLKQSWDPPVNL